MKKKEQGTNKKRDYLNIIPLDISIKQKKIATFLISIKLLNSPISSTQKVILSILVCSYNLF